MNAKFLGTGAVAVSFAAGLVMGVILHRAQPPRSRGPQSMLAEELRLSAAQQQKLRDIWSDPRLRPGPPPIADMQRLRAEREQQILELLTPQQQTRYREITEDYENRMEKLHEDSHRAFREAEEKTKEILTPDQREKYESMMRRPGPGPGPGPGGKREFRPPPPKPRR